MQGPSSACNWNSSSSRVCSEVAASRRSCSSGSASRKPGRRDIEQLGAAFGELGQQVDDVEVVEQAVDERDDRVQYTGFTRGFGHVSHSFLGRACISRPPACSRRSRMSRATSVALRPVA